MIDRMATFCTVCFCGDALVVCGHTPPQIGVSPVRDLVWGCVEEPPPPPPPVDFGQIQC